MKTKIKIWLLFFISIISLMGFTELDATWYGNHPYHNSWAGGWCDEDAQPDATGPNQWQDPASPYSAPNYPSSDWYPHYYSQRKVIGWWNGYNDGWMNCQYWDSTRPTASALGYAPTTTLGWQNNTNIVLNWSAIDTGGSGLRNTNIRVYRISGAQNTPVTLLATLLTPTNTTTYTYSGINGYAYKFEICPRDNANNVCSTWTTSPDIVRVDTTNPAPNSLVNTPAMNLLATTNQAFNFSYNDTGAPVQVSYRLEKNNDPTSYDAFTTILPFAYSYAYNRNISIVDNDRGGNGGRDISVLVDRICDQAGNCIGTLGATIKTIPHFVYANPNYGPTNTPDILSLTNAVADGVSRNVVYTIKDGYGNAIIPALGINRTVNMNLSAISNTMYLNQYDRSGGSSVFVDTNTIPLVTIPTQSIGLRSSTDGSYIFPLFVYTPTSNSYPTSDPSSDPLAAFTFQTNLTVSDTLIGPATTFSQVLADPTFRPLYTSVITGDLRNGGFIEGTEQASNITVTQASSALAIPSYFALDLAFSGSNTPNFNLEGGTTVYAPITNILTPLVGMSAPSSVAFFSQLSQKPDITINTLSNLEFSTHFSYTLDGKTVLYNSDIIGKTGGYWGTVMSGLGNQVGIKIIGPIASNAIRAIVDGQFADGTSIFGGISRADVRNKMRQSIALATRNMQLVIVGSTVDSLTIPNNSTNDAKGAYIDKGGNSSIYKIEKTGGNVTLALTPGISGKRTLVVKGANLYITTNMSYTDTSSILGVVVQKDEAGNGGNLYIDPGITNIVGTYIIDGSVMSYDGTSEIGVGDITTLKNQLYIYGSIVSENTIGGSRMSPLKCPSLLNVSCTTSAMAQKYDFNYLRRYYLFGGQPFGDGKVIGGGTCTSTTCSGFQPNLIQKFNAPTEELAKYPVIIEYNPLIRTSSPVGFELSRE